MESVEKAYEELKEELQCAVCLDVLKKPVMILACLHSFCSSCLEALAETASDPSPATPPSSSSSSSSSSDSPEEKVGEKRTRTDQEDSEAPPAKLQKVEPCGPKCPVCRRTFNLSQTSENLVAHSLLDKLESLSELLDHDPSDSPPSLPSSLTISPESQEKRDETALLIDSVDSRKEDIETTLSLIDKMETQIHANNILQKDNLDNFIAELTRQIEERRNELKKSLDNMSENFLNRLAQQRKQLEADLECLENSVKVSRSFIKNASDEHFSSHLPLISDQLTRLNEGFKFLRPPSEIAVPVLHEDKRRRLVEVYELFDRHFIRLEDSKEIIEEIRKVKTKKKTSSSSSRDFSKIKKPTAIVELPARDVTLHGALYNSKVTVNQKNHLIVTDDSEMKIMIFSPEGKLETSAHLRDRTGKMLKHTSGLAVDQDDNLFVVTRDTKSLVEMKSNGTFVSEREHGWPLQTYQKNYNGLAQFDKDHFLTCDSLSHQVVLIDRKNQQIKRIGDQKMFKKPMGVAVDKKNNTIVVCDSGNGRLVILNKEFEVQGTFGSKGKKVGQLSGPSDVAVDDDGNVFVLDTGNHRVQVFDENGNHLKSFGGKGNKEGKFDHPTGIVIDGNNRIVVSDPTNGRLQIF